MSLDLSFAKDLLPVGYCVRRLELNDYDLGVLDVLAELTSVGDISKEEFTDYIETLNSHENFRYTLVVVNSDLPGSISAVGSLILEPKLIHQCGLVGHIEDISVSSKEQGKGLGIQLIKILDHICQSRGAYKSILNCSEQVRSFYNKCGYQSTGHMMVSADVFPCCAIQDFTNHIDQAI